MAESNMRKLFSIYDRRYCTVEKQKLITRRTHGPGLDYVEIEFFPTQPPSFYPMSHGGDSVCRIVREAGVPNPPSAGQ